MIALLSNAGFSDYVLVVPAYPVGQRVQVFSFAATATGIRHTAHTRIRYPETAKIVLSQTTGVAQPWRHTYDGLGFNYVLGDKP